MKNVQIIDGAINTAYCIYSLSDRDFRFVFPDDHDIEFVEDFIQRVGQAKAQEIMQRLWKRPVLKNEVRGIHGTLFFELLEKKPFYSSKRELEMDGLPPQFRRFKK